MLFLILIFAEIAQGTVSKQFSLISRHELMKPLAIHKQTSNLQSKNLVNEDTCIWSIKNGYPELDLAEKTSNRIDDALKATCIGDIAIHLEDMTHYESLTIKDYLSKTEVSIEGYNTFGVAIGQTEWTKGIESDFILIVDEYSTISLRLKNILFIGIGAVKSDGDSQLLIDQCSFQLQTTERNDVVVSQYPFIIATKGILEIIQCSFGVDDVITNIGTPAISVKSGCNRFKSSLSTFTNLPSGAIDLEVGTSSTAQIEESIFTKCGSQIALSGGIYTIGQFIEDYDEEDCDDEDASPPQDDSPGSEPGYPGQEGYGQMNSEQSNLNHNNNININSQIKMKKNKCKGDVETQPSEEPPSPSLYPGTRIKKYKYHHQHQYINQNKTKSDSPVVYPCDQPIHGYPEQLPPEEGQGSGESGQGQQQGYIQQQEQQQGQDGEVPDCYYYEDEDDYIYGDREIGKVIIKGNQFIQCSGRITGGILFGQRVIPISATDNKFFLNEAIDAEGAKDILFNSKQLLDAAGGIELIASGYVEIQQIGQKYEGQVKIAGYGSNFAQYLNCKTESKDGIDCKEIPEGGQVVIPIVPYPEEQEEQGSTDIAIGIGIGDSQDQDDVDVDSQFGVGAIVGIIIGCVAVVAVVAVAVVLAVYFKKNKTQSKTESKQSVHNEVYMSKE